MRRPVAVLFLSLGLNAGDVGNGEAEEYAVEVWIDDVDVGVHEEGCRPVQNDSDEVGEQYCSRFHRVVVHHVFKTRATCSRVEWQ